MATQCKDSVQDSLFSPLTMLKMLLQMFHKVVAYDSVALKTLMKQTFVPIVFYFSYFPVLGDTDGVLSLIQTVQLCRCVGSKVWFPQHRTTGLVSIYTNWFILTSCDWFVPSVTEGSNQMCPFCKEFPLMSVSLLTLRADDSGCKLCCWLLAADGLVTLALAQRYLVSGALHAAHRHVGHVAAVPVPGFLRARDQTIANNHAAWLCHSKKQMFVTHVWLHADHILWVDVCWRTVTEKETSDFLEDFLVSHHQKFISILSFLYIISIKLFKTEITEVCV